MTGAAPSAVPDVLIIGAGAAGLCAGAQLAAAGHHDFTILDRNEGVGGTWRDNSYPGAACDVPSHLYSYSFDPKTDWSRKFAGQAEILDYFEQTATRHQLMGHVRTGVVIERADWDEDDQRWHLRSASGEHFSARVLISACGQLNEPRISEIDGLDSFEGETFHSARWRHDLDLADQRIGVIGNGASAVQFVPEIAPAASQLTVFQRSAHWIVPKDDAVHDDESRHQMAAQHWRAGLTRFGIWASLDSRFLFFGKGRRLTRLSARLGRSRLARDLGDPELAEALTPDSTPGCKRILISNDWYPTMRRDNVRLVGEPIERATPTGLVTADGEHHEFATIIHATGFHTGGFVGGVQITGRGGLGLDEAWTDGPEAHMGVGVNGFPNLFLLYGPNTNLGHNSIIFMIEQQVGLILDCVRRLVDENATSIEPSASAQADYNATLQDRLARTVFVDGCRSWYVNTSGKVTNNWSSSTLAYWVTMLRRGTDGYEVR